MVKESRCPYCVLKCGDVAIPGAKIFQCLVVTAKQLGNLALHNRDGGRRRGCRDLRSKRGNLGLKGPA
jgi:hypothetical protein